MSSKQSYQKKKKKRRKIMILANKKKKTPSYAQSECDEASIVYDDQWPPRCTHDRLRLSESRVQ